MFSKAPSSTAHLSNLGWTKHANHFTIRIPQQQQWTKTRTGAANWDAHLSIISCVELEHKIPSNLTKPCRQLYTEHYSSPWPKSTNTARQTFSRSSAYIVSTYWQHPTGVWCRSRLDRRRQTDPLARGFPPLGRHRGPVDQGSATSRGCYDEWCTSSSSKVPPGWSRDPNIRALPRTKDHTHRLDSAVCLRITEKTINEQQWTSLGPLHARRITAAPRFSSRSIKYIRITQNCTLIKR